MKRAPALKLLAGTLAVLVLASAFPLADMLPGEPADAPGASNPVASSGISSPPRLPFSPDPSAPGVPSSSAAEGPLPSNGPFPSGAGSGSAAAARDSASALSTGSALLDQVLGSARLMGYDVALPSLPYDKIAPVGPLRPAILEWVAVTGSQVPAEELAVELERADALPEPLQRDLALLVLSAAQASLLQAQALQRLGAEDVAWLHAHPELAGQLAEGVDSPDTRRLAALAALVDTPKSIQATLLLLQAVEATRGSLATHHVDESLLGLSGAGLDPATRGVLGLLAGAASRVSDEDKVRLAAELVAATTGLQVPASAPPATFREAVAALLAATGQQADPAELDAVLARADALPDDLERALAGPLMAQARAVRAAVPGAEPTAQAQALLGVLVASADALPTLQKYALYWREAPDALRVAQWTPTHRVGWAAEHAGLFLSAGASPADAVRAGAILHGLGLLDADVPPRGFADAFAALAAEAGLSPTAAERAEVADAAGRLPPAARDAAAVMMSGAAEAARLRREAFAALGPDEEAYLFRHSDLVASLSLKPRPTPEELATLARVADLSARVDAALLAKAGIVGAKATMDAKQILDGQGAYATATAGVAPMPSLWQRLLALVPWGSARAQAPTDGADDRAACAPVVGSVVTSDCANDVLLRIAFTARPRGADCDERVCNLGVEDNAELLVVTGTRSSNLLPQEATRRLCDLPDLATCMETRVAASGAPLVHLDLGGADAYDRPVAVTTANATARVSLHLDASGADAYLDPSHHYDGRSPFMRLVGSDMGHPTQGSALFGGVAILVDAVGDDSYAAATRSQGYGRYGVGMLVDLAGSDSYRGGALVQGASGEGFNLGLGLHLDALGDDRRVAKSGMGHGLGGVLLDLQGRDGYQSAGAHPRGVPLVRTSLLPDNLTVLDRRRDDSSWLDGPGDLNLGIGVDQETNPVRGADRDGDGWTDLQEFVAGSDPDDRGDVAPEGPQSRAARFGADADADAYPDFVERAFSTDPHDAASYPAGFPLGPTFHDPTGIVGDDVTPGQLGRDAADGPERGDKVLDLRLPLQDALGVEDACTDEVMLNLTEPLPYGLVPGNLLEGFNDPAPPSGSTQRRGERCVFATYEPQGDGSANASQPDAGRPGDRRGFTFRMPAGILAVGDSVATRYDLDYFFVVDLGGDDGFHNLAGGALPVQTKAETPRQGDASDPRRNAVNATGVYNLAYLAPSLVVNVDPAGWGDALRNPQRRVGADRYLAPAARPDFAHGSLWGVLVDTAGNDTYVAGSGSQGSSGGVLLDLGGPDGYQAGNLSQGASVATGTRRAHATLPEGNANPTRDAFARRVVPGMLLDFSHGDRPTDKDSFVAASHGMGFARSFVEETVGPCGPSEPRCMGASPLAYGILLSQGGPDSYDTRARGGVHTMGVGTQLGVGILADLSGDDDYDAGGGVSLGAPVTTSYPRTGPAPSAQTPGAGILVDLAGQDDHLQANRSVRRENNLTFTRAAMGYGSEGRSATLHADLGIHLDAQPGGADDPLRPLDAVGGGQRAVNGAGYLLHLPSARLAVGSDASTTYRGTDYAFIVDLGGDNVYDIGAAGLVPAAFASARPTGPDAAFRQEHVAVSLYPASLLVDAGQGSSLYRGGRAFSQGAGFFSVGVLVDNGGGDEFTVLPARLPSFNGTWMRSPPTLDGAVTDAEWAGVPLRELTFQSVNDSRVTTTLLVRVANDADNLYLAVQGRTASASPEERRADKLVVDLDRGARRLGGGIDEVVLASGLDRCDAHDRAYTGITPVTDPMPDAKPSLKAGCVSSETGSFAFELQKPLREAFPRDAGDLNLAYDDAAGWTDGDRLGLHLEFVEAGTGTVFTWPPGSTVRDGELGHRLDANLSDEMSTWAVAALASLGNATPAPLATRDPVFSQGAGFAGVGVLAMLGTHHSDATLNASQRAMGYGAYGGLGILVDAAGDDRYEAADLAQGASETQGFGLLIENEGNDQYRGGPRALGWAGADAPNGALFVDLYGNDAYAHRPPSISPAGLTSADLSTVAPAGNERAWAQGAGAGVDQSLSLAAGKAISNLVQSQIFGATRTTLQVTKLQDGRCTDAPVEQYTVDVPQPKPVVNGLVCLRAYVDLDGGSVPDPLAHPLANGAEPLVSVDGVEFLLDGTRYAAGRLVDGDRENPGTLTTWEAVLNGTLLDDGARKLAALTVFRVEQQGKGAILFYDDIDPGDVESPSVKSVYVNNPPRVTLGLKPPFLGAAQAAFSPLASAPALPHLAAGYAVSRDAGEDRLEISQGWKAPPSRSNVPCHDGVAGKLCHLLPLYFTTDGLMTDPRGSPGERQTKTEAPGGVAPFEQLTPTLLTPLVVTKKESFRVALPDHNTTLPVPGEYKTRVLLALRDANNADYKVDGKQVVLFEGVFTSYRTPATTDTAPLVFNALRPTMDRAADALDQNGAGLRQNPLSLLVGTLGARCAPGGQDVGSPGLLSYCEQWGGDPGATGNANGRVCRMPSQGNVLDTLRNAYRELLCEPSLGGWASVAANESEVPVVTGVSHMGGEAMQDAARALRPSVVTDHNWTEYRFDVDPRGLQDLGDRVVIPAGTRLYLQIRSETQLFPESGGSITATYADVVDAYLDAAQDVRDTGVPTTVDTGFGVVIDPLGEVGNLLITRKSDVKDTEKRVSSLAFLPFSYFTYQGGGEDQARLEVRIPADATTEVKVEVERPDGQKMLDLVAPRAVQGDVAGSPTRAGRTLTGTGTVLWKAVPGDVRFTQHEALFDGVGPSGNVSDGLYRLRVKATDFSGRESNASGTFLLDRTPPASVVTTRAFAGAAYVENNAIPVTWRAHETGSGLSRVAVYGRAGGSPGDAGFGAIGPGAWRLLGVFPASVATSSFTLETGIDTYWFASVAEDRVGNVERAVNQADPFKAGFLAKLARGEVHRVVVDQSRPTMSLPDVPIVGARVVDHRGADVPFVKAGAPVAFRACAGDAAGAAGIAVVRLVLDQVNVTSNEVLSRNFTASLVGACPNGQALYEYGGWGALNLNKTDFPDGAWAVSFDAYDLAGNRIQLSLGSVILDSKPPTLTLQDPVYPPGQSALKPGDLVSVRVLSEDAHGVDGDAILVDASVLNKTGKIGARLVRVDGLLVHEATFRVDAPVENLVYAVTVFAPDLAGNVQTAQAHVAVDYRKFSIEPGSVRVTDVTHNGAVLRWNTTENTTGQARYGTGPLELRQRTALTTNLTREHAVKVEGLQPSTHYWLRALSTSAGGQVNESESVEIVTTTALYLEAMGPKAGSQLSGVVGLAFKGGLRDSAAPVTYTVEVQPRPTADWTFVTTLTRGGAEHVLPLNTSRLLDGGAYRVRLSAEAGKDRASLLMGPYAFDNTPPALSVHGPLLATNDTTPLVLAEAHDLLSGLGADAATLRIDGKPVDGLQVEAFVGGARIRHQVVGALAQGEHVFELRVRDRAGAESVETWRVSVDGEAPIVATNPLRFAPGTGAARTGGTVTLNVTVTDASGVASVTADLAGLSRQGTLRLSRLLGTDHYVGTFPVTASEETGTRRVAITALDLAGNERLAGVDVAVDNAPPRVGDVRHGEPGHTAIDIRVAEADEPVTLLVTATAPDSPPVVASTTEPTLQPRVALAGLLPSRTYEYDLRAVDRAGNVAELGGRFTTLADTVKPGMVRGLAATDLLDGTLRLAWTPATDDVAVSHYRVWRDDVPVAEVREPTYEDAGLPLERAFAYHVSAVDYGANEGASSETVRASATALPRLTGGVAGPAVGTPSTLFQYQVTYVSPGGREPFHVRLILDGVAQTMTRQDGGSALEGIVYTYETRLAPHKRDQPHTYAFETSDGRYVARYPEDGSVLRGPLVAGDLAAEAEEGGFAAFAQRVPLGGAALTAAGFVAAIALAALVVRRAKSSSKEGPK